MEINKEQLKKLFELAGLDTSIETAVSEDINKALILIERKMIPLVNDSVSIPAEFNILIVDDLELSIYQFNQVLKKVGIIPTVARNKAEASAELKKKKYMYSKEFKSKYNIVKIMSSGNIYDISFKDKYGVYEVCGYLGPTQEENLFSFLERLSKTIDTECKKVDRIIKMPIFVQKIVLFYEKNHRIEQYIQKKYLTQEEQIFWRYRMPVALYDL